MELRLTGFAAVSSLVAVVAGACSPFDVSAGSEESIQVTMESTAAPAKQSADALPCAQGAGGMQVFADEAHGFCVLVPQGFTMARPDDHEVAAFASSTPVDGYLPLCYIMVADAQGKTAAEIAAKAVAEAEGMELKVRQETITLSGEQAVVVDGLPGQDVTRKIFVVHNGTQYEIAFTPANPDLKAYESVQSLYKAVVGSFSFMR